MSPGSGFYLQAWLCSLIWTGTTYPWLSERLFSHGHKLEADTLGLTSSRLHILMGKEDLVLKHCWLSVRHVAIPGPSTTAREMLWFARPESHVALYTGVESPTEAQGLKVAEYPLGNRDTATRWKANGTWVALRLVTTTTTQSIMRMQWD